MKYNNLTEDEKYIIEQKGTDYTYVGRIRKDVYASNIIHYFNVADQVRVGA